MNVAILIAVDHYDRLMHLPGCRGDEAAMRTLLTATTKYSHIFGNEDRQDSRRIKSWLRGVIESLSNKEVDELLFYFSGHGTLDTDEFIYCCKDFDATTPRTTSLRNQEVDSLFRSLKPKTMVKIIDACHSGKKIIKDDATFAKSLENPGYRNFIQFASSMEEQYSFADENMSHFTADFVRGACS